MFNSQFHVGMFIECPKLVEVVLKQCMPVGALQAPHRIHLDGCLTRPSSEKVNKFVLSHGKVVAA